MKSQRTVKTGAAIGSAVALLLILALLAPSSALAGSKFQLTVKLIATDVEPQAFGQAKLAATVGPGNWGPVVNASVTVSCKGLTPGKQYYLEIESAYNTYYGDGVASRNGSLTFEGGFQSGYPLSSCSVSVYSDAGVVLWGFLP